MKKFHPLRIIVFLVFISPQAYSQSSYFRGLNSIGGPGQDVCRGISYDPVDNLFLTGSFANDCSFDPFTIKQSAGGTDIFAAKYTNDGQLLWCQNFGSIRSDFSYDTDSDTEGNMLITGSYAGSIAFGDFALETFGRGDAFTAKLSPEGQVLWVKTLGGSENDLGNEIVTDAANNVLSIGVNGAEAQVEGALFGNEEGGIDTYVVKYSPAGDLLWAVPFTGPQTIGGRGVATDDALNVLVTGEFQSSVTVGGITLPNAHTEFRDAFIAKFDADGNLFWAKSFGSTGEDYGRGIGCDAAGNVYFSGVFTGTLNFDGLEVTSNNNSRDIYLAQCDAAGTVNWVITLGGAFNDEGCELNVDAGGNTFISGNFLGTIVVNGIPYQSSGIRDTFIAKVDPYGNIVWFNVGGGAGDDVTYAIATSSNAQFNTVVGTFTGAIDYGGFPAASAGGVDAFIVQVQEDVPLAGAELSATKLPFAYPNPTSGGFTLREAESSNVFVECLNATGKVVFAGTVPTNQRLTFLNNYPTGVYLLRIKGKRMSTAKIIKN